MDTIMAGLINFGFLVIVFTNQMAVRSSPIHRTAVSEIAKSNCALKGLARYNITFEGLWSKDIFLKQYPMYRPNAQWSKILGRIHSSEYSLWKMGTQSSNSLRKFVERGKSEDFDKRETQGNGGIFDSFQVKPITTGVGKTWTVVFADEEHHLVSTAAKIVPSPDWFTGVDSIDLCNNNRWLESKTIELHPLDAGTDKGFTFTAPNWMENPFRPIYQITSQFPSHAANSFYYPDKNELPPIAKLHIQLLSNYGQRNKINADNFYSRDEYPHSSQQSHSEEGKTSASFSKTNTKGGTSSPDNQVTADKQIYYPATTNKGNGSTIFGITQTKDEATHNDMDQVAVSRGKEQQHVTGMDSKQNIITEIEGQSEIPDDTITAGYVKQNSLKFKNTEDYENNNLARAFYAGKKLVDTESFKHDMKSTAEHKSLVKYGGSDISLDISGHLGSFGTQHPSEQEDIPLTIASQNSKTLVSSNRPIVKISVINSKLSSSTTDGMTRYHDDDDEQVDLSHVSEATKRISNILIPNERLESKLKPTISNYTGSSQKADQSENVTVLRSKSTGNENTAAINQIYNTNSKLRDSLQRHTIRHRVPTFFTTTQTILNDFVHEDLVKEHHKKLLSENVNQTEKEPESIASNEENKWKLVDCVLSEEWGEWTPCSQSCGYGTRTRVKLTELQSENGGAMCKQTPEVDLCGSMRTCTQWKHFSFRNWGMGSHEDDHLKVQDD